MLHTEANLIKNHLGSIVQLRGVSQPEVHEASLIQPWYRHHQVPAQYDWIRSLGCNIVRAIIDKTYWDSNPTIISIEGIPSSYREIIRNMADMCLARSIYFLICFEGPDRANYLLNPETSGWLPTLRELATEYAGYSNVLIDPMNEPARAGAYTEESIQIWRNAAVQAIEVIRLIAPDMVLLVQPSSATYSANMEFSDAHGLGHLPYANIVYGGHHYLYSGTVYHHPWVLPYLEGRFKDAKNFRPPELYVWGVDRPSSLMEELYYGEFGVLYDENVPVMIDEFGTRLDRTIHYEGTYPTGQWVTDVESTGARLDPGLILEQDGPFTWYTELTDFYQIMNDFGWGFIQHAWRAEWGEGYDTVYNTMLYFGWAELNEIGVLFKDYGFGQSICVTGQMLDPEGKPILDGTAKGNSLAGSLSDVNGRFILHLPFVEVARGAPPINYQITLEDTNLRDRAYVGTLTSHLLVRQLATPISPPLPAAAVPVVIGVGAMTAILLYYAVK